MDIVLENKKNVIVSSLVLVLAMILIMVAFLWLKLDYSNSEKRYLSYLVGKQRELERLLVQENKILREKAHIPADRAVLALEKKKTSKGNRGFFFWKGTPKDEAVVKDKEKTSTSNNRGFLFRKGTPKK